MNNIYLTLEDCDNLLKFGYCVSIKNIGNDIYLLYSKNE